MKTKALVFLTLVFFNLPFVLYAVDKNSADSKISKKEIIFDVEKPELIILNELSRKAKVIEFNNQELFFYDGNYFLFSENQFTQTLPPLGFPVKSIPENYERIIKDGQVIYYASGIYYYKDMKNKGFLVGKGLVGIQIKNLPEKSVKAKFNNRDCYVYYNTVYKKSTTRARESYTFIGYIED